MNSINDILVVLDAQQEEQPALERAVYVAEATGARLHLFLCAYDAAIGIATFLTGGQKKTFVQTIIDGSEVQVDKLAQPLKNKGLDVTCEVTWDRHQADAIVELCESRHFDLVMKYARSRNRADAMFNPVDWNLMRSCPVPLMLVKEGHWDEVGQVLAAVDPAPEEAFQQNLNQAVLEEARLLADLLDFELHLVSAYPPPPVFAPVSVAVQQQVNYRSKMTAMVDEHLATLAQAYDVPLDRLHALEGPVDWVVPNVADELVAEFVVLGNVSRQGKAGISIGSTAESTLDALNTNVLMVRASD